MGLQHPANLKTSKSSTIRNPLVELKFIQTFSLKRSCARHEIRERNMSFDYLSDIFGKLRKKKTRFYDVERKAIELLKSFVDGSINSRDFAVAFDAVRVDFYKLVRINGEATIDEDTPLWMNSFFGFHFMDWYKFQQVKWYFEDHPEELTDERREKLDHLKSNGYDEKFLEICNTILKELK